MRKNPEIQVSWSYAEAEALKIRFLRMRKTKKTKQQHARVERTWVFILNRFGFDPLFHVFLSIEPCVKSTTSLNTRCLVPKKMCILIYVWF